jgi:hypothetical protein
MGFFPYTRPAHIVGGSKGDFYTADQLANKGLSGGALIVKEDGQYGQQIYMLCYNGTGGALTKYTPYYMMPMDATTGYCPAAVAITDLAFLDVTILVAQSAVGIACWGWFCVQGRTPMTCTSSTAHAVGDAYIVQNDGHIESTDAAYSHAVGEFAVAYAAGATTAHYVVLMGKTITTPA